MASKHSLNCGYDILSAGYERRSAAGTRLAVKGATKRTDVYPKAAWYGSGTWSNIPPRTRRFAWDRRCIRLENSVAASTGNRKTSTKSQQESTAPPLPAPFVWGAHRWWPRRWIPLLRSKGAPPGASEKTRRAHLGRGAFISFCFRSHVHTLMKTPCTTTPCPLKQRVACCQQECPLWSLRQGNTQLPFR